MRKGCGVNRIVPSLIIIVDYRVMNIEKIIDRKYYLLSWDPTRHEFKFILL